MDRFPIIITLGGMLLGWIAGQDPSSPTPALKPYLPEGKAWEYGAAAFGALLVLLIAKLVQAQAAVGGRSAA